ncbi:MAG: pyridoxal-phosphate dependent enzyme [Myxococcota bacterium]
MDSDGSNLGPTYGELLDPASITEDLREAARIARHGEASDPLSLYNLHWMDDLGEVTSIVLPSEFTGLSTRIVVMLGEKFPAGSAHTGPAYAMLMERQLHGEITPGEGRIIVPSTGAFGLSAAWAARVMGYAITAVVPRSALETRQPALQALGAQVEAGGDTPADILDTIDAAWSHAKEGDVVLNPYDDFAPYRYHALVTSAAIRALVNGSNASEGSARLAALVAPTGAGALLAAGESLTGVAVLAAEPAECAPLADGTVYQHSVADAGPRVPIWTDNLMALDGAVSVPHRDYRAVAQFLSQPSEVLEALGVREAAAQRLSGSCGPAACLAIAAGLKVAQFYGFGSQEVVVVAAPDSGSLPALGNEEQARSWFDAIRSLRPDGVIEATTRLRRRWHHLKYGPWVERRGKGVDALRRQQDPEFWAEQRSRASSIDRRIMAFRSPA